MHDGRQIDLSEKVELVKRKTRPWKSIIALLLLAIAADVISHRARHYDFLGKHIDQVVFPGTVVLFLVFGFSATYGLAGKAKELLEPKAGTQHSAVFRYAILLIGILLIGAFTTLVITLGRSASSSSAAR